MIRYRIVIDGRLTARLASGLDGVELAREGTELRADIANAEALEALLQRIGDFGVKVVSLCQLPAGGDPPMRYRVVIRGELDARARERIGEPLVRRVDGFTVLVCDVVDQSQLVGLLTGLTRERVEVVSAEPLDS